MKKRMYKCLEPVLAFGWLVAVNPPSNSSSRKSLLYCYFTLYSTLIFTFSVLALFYLGYYELPFIHLFLRRCEVVISFTNYVVALGTAFGHEKNLVNVLKRLEDVDKELSTIGIFVKYKNDHILKILAFLVVSEIFFLFIEFSLSRTLDLDYTIYYILGKYLSQFSVSALQIQAYSVLKFIGNHFFIMGDKIQEMNGPPNWDKILCFVRLYDILKQKALSVNHFYSLNTISSLTSSFFNILVTLHLLATLRKNNVNSSIILFVFCISFALFKLYEIWISIEPFVFVTDKVNRFNDTLFRIMVSNNVGRYVGNEKLQLHISLKQGIVFSAAGFFPLDYSIIHSMIGAIATFLVILIQFDHEKS